MSAELTLLVPSFALFGFAGTWLTQSFWGVVGVASALWLLVLGVPFSVSEPLQVRQLMAPLFGGALAALIGGRVRCITPLVGLEIWDTVPPEQAALKEPLWSTDKAIGYLVACATLAVLAYGIGTGVVAGDAPTSLSLAFTIGVAVAAVVVFGVGVYQLTRSSSARLTLLYAFVLLVWCSLLPLLFLLPSPWNLVLVFAALFVGTVVLSVFCTRLHASMRLQAPESTDVRLAPSETRFPRHMARWLLFGALHAVVYGVAFSNLGDFETAILSVLVVQAVFTVLLLMYTCACRTVVKSEALVNSVLPVTSTARTVPLTGTDSDDDDDPFAVGRLPTKRK